MIIPVYNAEKCLAECLGNIVNQTLRDIEVILVNDASTDNSISVIKACECQYPEIVRVIDSKKNLGAGGARNLGIEMAKGEYIGFVDSDDLVDVTMYEKLYMKAKEGDYDLVDCGYYKQADNLAIIHTSDELTGMLDTAKRKQSIVGGGYIVTKLFRRELFRDSNLRFRKNVILEDADFLTYLYATVGKVGSVKEVLYYYRDNASSSSNVKDLAKYYEQICKAMRGIHQKLMCVSQYADLQDAIEYEMLQMYSFGINACLKKYIDDGDAAIRAKLEEIAELKREVVAGGYENQYVQAKIDKMDIEIMQMNDKCVEQLLRWCDSRMGE